MAQMTPLQFIEKWQKVNIKESAAAQSHFNDLCDLLEHPKPLEADPDGTWFTFEFGAEKTSGRPGFADVFYKKHFGWEYKGKKKDLTKAYEQLQQYAPALSNPPLLITCDMERFIIHTNWNDLVSEKHEIALEELLNPDKLNLLRHAFHEPDKLKPKKSRQELTEEIAGNFAKISEQLRKRGNDPHEVAHFVNRLIFCMFAEDIGLLPKSLFTDLINKGYTDATFIQERLSKLFKAMNKGGDWGSDDIKWFNGGLFDNDKALKLEPDEIKLIFEAAKKDWSDIDPSIMGTLFERGLDPKKQSQLGAHYTDREMIMKIINPVINDPLEMEWESVKKLIEAELLKAEDYRSRENTKANAAQGTKAENRARKAYNKFIAKVRHFKVLDPACGSGNFLYLSLNALKDMERKISLYGEATFGLPQDMPEIGPENIYGIEINPYAAELARVSVWIGEIQWIKKHGFTVPANPVLRKLKNIVNHDALINEDGSQYAWPKVDVVVGNPPFIGARKLKPELGKTYVEILRKTYKGLISNGSDFVCFWFLKSHDYMRKNQLKRAGLVSTNSIRGGKNRLVLDGIFNELEIFNAWADEAWINDGASVRVSMTCFGVKKQKNEIKINGQPAEIIYSDLTARIDNVGTDLSQAKKLTPNKKIAFQGVVPRSEVNKKAKENLGLPDASFFVSGEKAREFLSLPTNPNGRPNADVLAPCTIGRDITGRSMDRFIVDFGNMSENEAALYEAPYEYILPVKEHRAVMDQKTALETWWMLWRSRPEMKEKLQKHDKYICTPRVSKHRVFVWISTSILPDNATVAICRDDDLTFGIVHSKFHELWALSLCTFLGKGNDPRYTPTSCFETFPFPKSMEPNQSVSEQAKNPKAQKIADAAARLNELRENWLNPSDLVKQIPEVVKGIPCRLIPVSEEAEKILKKRTLTNLYNEKPAWLLHAHKELDDAVAGAYGWPLDLSDDEILEKLFELNQERTT